MRTPHLSEGRFLANLVTVGGKHAYGVSPLLVDLDPTTVVLCVMLSSRAPMSGPEFGIVAAPIAGGVRHRVFNKIEREALCKMCLV
jgi:hypothetical protein